jgi:hypothetical protein
MAEREPKFIVGGAKPVNLRRSAAEQAAARPPAVAPVARERVLAVHARNRLGAPLAEQLRSPLAAARSRQPVGKVAVVGGMTTAAGAMGLLLAWLQASMLGAAGAAVVAGVGLVVVLRAPKPPALAGIVSLDAEPPVLVNPASVEAFDRALAALNNEVSPPVLQALVDFKALVVRLARHPAAGAVDEHFRLDDRMYVNECLRRYLPDSLQSYLAVPKEQRLQAVAEGQSPEALLLSQLAMLRSELEAREQKLARSASEGLLRQERFLKSKAGR